MAAAHLFECCRKKTYYVGSHEGVFAQLICSSISRKGVERNTEESGFKRGIALRQKCNDNARQDVSATCCPHAAVAPRTSVFCTIGGIDVGRMSFENKHHAMSLGEELRRLFSSYSAVFCRMRREDSGGRQDGKQRGIYAYGVEGVSVEDARHAESLDQLLTKCLDGAFVGAYSGTYCDRIISSNVHSFGKAFCIGIVMHNGLGHTYLHNVVVALRNVSRDLPYSTPQASLKRQHASTTHTVLARNDEGVAKGTFVAICRTWAQDAA